MKRAGGRSDRDFINDLQNDRYVDPELSSDVFRKCVTQTVEARMELIKKLEEAGIPNPMIGILKAPKVLEVGVDSVESELNQWLTESETSENLLMNPSETNEATATGVYSETIHST